MGSTERFEAESTEPKAGKSAEVRSDRFDEKPAQRDAEETASGSQQTGSRFYSEADLSDPANRGGAGSRAGASVPMLELKDQEGSATRRTSELGAGGGSERNRSTEPKAASEPTIQKATFDGGVSGGGSSVRSAGGDISKQSKGEAGRPDPVSREVAKLNPEQGRAGTGGQAERQSAQETKPGIEGRPQAPAAGKQTQELTDTRKNDSGGGGGGFNRDGQQLVEKSTGDKLNGGGRTTATANDSNALVDKAKVASDLHSTLKPEQNQVKALEQNPSKSFDQQNPTAKSALPSLEIKQQPEAKNADRANATKPDSEVKGKINEERTTKVSPDQLALEAKKANALGAEQKINQVQAAATLQQQAEKNTKATPDQLANAPKDQTSRLEANTANRAQLDLVAADKLNKLNNNAAVEKTLPALSMTKASETETAEKGKKKNELNEVQQYPVHSGYSASKSETSSAARENTAAVTRESQMARTAVDANTKLDMAKIQAISLSSAAQSERNQVSNKPANDLIAKVDAIKVDANRIDVRRDEQRAIETGKATKDGAVLPTSKDALTVSGKDFIVAAGKDGNFTVGGRNGHISARGNDANSNHSPSGDLIVRGGRIAGFSPINAHPGDREGTIRSINAETGRRYLTGAEIGLLIALAGIAKKRSDDVSAKAESCQKNNSEVEKKAEPIKKLDERKAETENKELEIIKRFPGKEITVSAMIAFTGVSKGKEVDYQQAVSASNLVTTQIERTLGTTVRPEKSEAKTIQTSSTPMGTLPYNFVAASESKSNQKYDSLDLMQLLPSVSIMRSRKKSEETEGQEEAIESQENTSTNTSLQDERETHKIVSGETLLSIAEKRYGDEKLGWLIANLNANKIKETILENRRVVEIMVGEKLVLPTAKEIRQFHENKAYNVPATHLVTILIERSFDRAFIDEQLSIVFGCQRGAV